MMLTLLLNGGRAAEAAELSLCPVVSHREHRILRSSHLEIKNTHILYATGCRILDTFCLRNSVPSRLFTSTTPVTDLETAAVHLKVTSCVLKEINKQEVRIRREFCLLFVSILHVIRWEIHPQHSHHVIRLCLSLTWDESFIHSVFICHYKTT